MKIAVCIKAVPDPNQFGKIKIDPVKKTLIREGIDTVINPSDLHAIELAMQLKEKFSAEVSLFTMGPNYVDKQIREGLSYGADNAYLMSDRAFGGADTLATSYVLACGIRKAGDYDLIIAGNESADGATTHVPSQIGEWMNIPHIMEVVNCEFEDETTAIVRKKADDNFINFRVKLPAVLAVNKSINKVRLPNIKGIMSAKRKPLTVLGRADFDDMNDAYLGLSGSPTQNGDLKTISYARECEEIKGSSQDIAKAILEKLRPVVETL